MSYIFGKPTNGSHSSQQSKPVIRKVARPAAKANTNGSSTSDSRPPPVDRYQLSQNPKFKKPARPTPKAAAAKPEPRPKPVAQGKSHLSGVQSSAKRKSASPLPTFTSDSEGDSDDGFGFFNGHVNKKSRRQFKVDPGRKITDIKKWSEVNNEPFELVHGADLTSGDLAKIYTPIFKEDASDPLQVFLQYPGASQREVFSLVTPSAKNEFSPLDEIVRVMQTTLEHYLPSSKAKALLDGSTGLEYRLKRAWRHLNKLDLVAVINEYNDTIENAREDGTSAHALDEMEHLPLPLLELILDQISARTVSLQIETLKKYEAFSDNTYGELRPSFVSEIFQQTGLTSSSVFLDLGSGVGNVTLQAALEIGCESHGIEVMENPCKLARAQAQEFLSRCRMWGISVGSVNLLQGDFLEDTRVTSVLQKADVILVNNQAFQPELNASLTQLFLDLKEGAKIVSLKSFVPQNWKLVERTRDSIIGVLEVTKKEYWSGCVSWKDEGGDYYITTKDSSRINRILDGNRVLDSKRRRR
ncbi:MAG: Nucleosomal histone H3-Lys79 methylase [Chrysothrix sp. TS-e1954]|nr:MAG: Nucleosomal histone H3-Lys79 methylase [Chrysothrix sp. TS-e1954]